jgi:hypothetical protein
MVFSDRENNNIENTIFLGIGFLLGYLYKSYILIANNNSNNKNVNYKVDVFDNKNNPLVTNYYIDDILNKIFFEEELKNCSVIITNGEKSFTIKDFNGKEYNLQDNLK